MAWPLKCNQIAYHPYEGFYSDLAYLECALANERPETELNDYQIDMMRQMDEKLELFAQGHDPMNHDHVILLERMIGRRKWLRGMSIFDEVSIRG